MYEIQTRQFKIQSTKSHSIFDDFKRHGCLINHSCLSGRCGNCKAKVIEGESQLVLPELGLTDSEKEQKFILTCVRRAASDMILDLDVLKGVTLEEVRTVPAKISTLTKVSEDVIKLVMRLPPGADFKFLPGQYVNFIRGSIKRSYSIGGVEGENTLVFYIKRYLKGYMSKYLFEEARENDLLRIEGPFGSFFLRRDSLNTLVFLATGTGIAPILSILTSTGNEKVLEDRKVFLFQGGRVESDLIGLNYFRSSTIHYYPTLSRVRCEGFRFGRIQKFILDQDIDLSNATVYACGSKKMIEDAKELLFSKGLSRGQFYADAFLESN
ncbi:FAD-binding oxidoreductase [Cyclobacterium xiamenense]|uniref:FAD-binding oxidoreductase n=1 Tax=Cyclobacterium xiamenense TaxID=1297121 RepID=UPI0012B7CF39|nr:FAD-binding oxidoreductase [Cyclobacterium xiamenense]